MSLGLNAAVLPSIGYAISLSQRGRTEVPVAPASYIYSHFKHVSGVPAPKGVEGVSLTKLQILDVLIDQLSQIKRQSPARFRPAGSASDRQIDALIKEYEKQIRAAQPAPYKPVPSPAGGTLFSIST